MALGKKIRFHRELQRMTLERLSDLSGVDVGTISALEVRDSKRSQYASAIAKALGMTTEQLLDDELTIERRHTSYASLDSWPFKSISRQAIELLSDVQRQQLEELIAVTLRIFATGVSRSKIDTELDEAIDAAVEMATRSSSALNYPRIKDMVILPPSFSVPVDTKDFAGKPPQPSKPKKAKA